MGSSWHRWTTRSSLLMKLLIRRLLEEGERRVLYFAFDLHENPDILRDTIHRARELHPDSEGPWYLFLDEVTSVPGWQRGIKVAWDQGLTRRDFLLLTGSSAHDLKVGAEQLHRAFRTYQRLGGFPAAIRDYRTAPDRRAQPQTVRMLWSATAGAVAASGRSQTAAAKLLEEVAVAMGNPLKWSGAAKAMGMASATTAKEYVEFLSEGFSLLTVFFWDLSGGTLQPGKQRKVYFMDPLAAEIAPLLMPGARRSSESGLVDNAVAVGLFRSATHVIAQAGPVPGAVGYWRSSNNRELDFVIPAESHGRGGRFPISPARGDRLLQLSGESCPVAKQRFRCMFGGCLLCGMPEGFRR